MKNLEPYGISDLICNDLDDYNDGCVNSLIIASGIAEATKMKKTTIITIREENDSGTGDEIIIGFKLPMEFLPEDICLSNAHKYALVLVRVRD